MTAIAALSPARPSLLDRVRGRLRQGATAGAIARAEGISQVLAQIIIDDLTRRGAVGEAQSLCSSGLGMCGGGASDQARIHCSGCPLVLR